MSEPSEDLPIDIIRSILGFLDAQSLCCATQVNGAFRTAGSDDSLWRRLALEFGAFDTAVVCVSASISRIFVAQNCFSQSADQFAHIMEYPDLPYKIDPILREFHRKYTNLRPPFTVFVRLACCLNFPAVARQLT